MNIKIQIAAAALAAIGLGATILPSDAGRVRDRAYADSFGNLIVLSPSGYKRILVGKGHLIDGIDTGEADDVIYYHAPATYTSQHRFPSYTYRCSGGATVVRGRSYRYGLTRDEVAVIGGDC